MTSAHATIRPSKGQIKKLLEEMNYNLENFFVSIVEADYRDNNSETIATEHELLLWLGNDVKTDESDDCIGFIVRFRKTRLKGGDDRRLGRIKENEPVTWYVWLESVDLTWLWGIATGIVADCGWGRQGLLTALATWEIGIQGIRRWNSAFQHRVRESTKDA